VHKTNIASRKKRNSIKNKQQQYFLIPPAYIERYFLGKEKRQKQKALNTGVMKHERSRRKRAAKLIPVPKRKRQSKNQHLMRNQVIPRPISTSPSDLSSTVWTNASIAYSNDSDLNRAACILIGMSQNQIKNKAMTLALPEDKDHLNSLHCFVRSNLLEIVVVSDSRNKTKSCFDRVGLQCAHCARTPKYERDSGASFFPHCLDDIYRMVCNWQRTHFQTCHNVPADVKSQYWDLKNKDKSRGKVKYWADSARKVGLANYLEAGSSISGPEIRKKSCASTSSCDEETVDDFTYVEASKSSRMGIRFLLDVK